MQLTEMSPAGIVPEKQPLKQTTTEIDDPNLVPLTTVDHPIVFGAGVMRTGTKSLQMALEKLLDGPCYHMTRVFEQPHHIETWRQACRQELTPLQWQELFQGYRAAVDMPTCVFYRQLLRLYPKAKFILTVRDARAWYRSVLRTVYKANEEMKSIRVSTILRLTPLAHHAVMVDELCDYVFGPKVDWHNETLMIQRYEQHIQNVKETIPSEQLLLFDFQEGWKPLCSFLGVEEPSEPYPHLNDTVFFTNNWRSFLRKQYRVAGKQLCLLIASICCCACFGIMSMKSSQ